MAQLYINGTAKQTELSKAFGINVIAVKRAAALYREKGTLGFFEAPKRGGKRILTPDVIETIQAKLEDGNQLYDIAEELNIKLATIKKAFQDGRLKKEQLNKSGEVTTKSKRSVQDSNSPIGMGATDVMGRLFARIGLVKGQRPGASATRKRGRYDG